MILDLQASAWICWNFNTLYFVNHVTNNSWNEHSLLRKILVSICWLKVESILVDENIH